MGPDQLFILIISVTVLSMKPGPGSIALVSRALNDGFFPAFAMAMGAIVVEIFYFILTAKGFALIQTYLAPMAVILKLVGATYLIYFGIQSLRNLKSGFWQGRTDTQRKRFLVQNFVTGVVICLSNPLVILFYMGLIPAILDLQSLNWPAVLTAVLVIFCVHFIVLSSQCLLAAQLREVLKDTKIVRGINLFSAAIFIAIGLYIAWSVTMIGSQDFSLILDK